MESRSHFTQYPCAPDMGRRIVEVTSEESEGVTTSKPEAWVPPRCESYLFDSLTTAASQRQAPSTKPDATSLVASWWPSDETKRTSLQGQSLLPSLTLKGTVCLENTEPSRSFSLQASVTENASESAGHHDGGPRSNWKNIASESAGHHDEGPPCNWKNTPTEDRKSQYIRDLCLQIEERKHQRECERNRNVLDERKHNDTILRSVWGLPGCGAPNYHLGTARRSERLRLEGILPQPQTRVLLPEKQTP